MWDSGRTRVARPLRYGSAPCAGRGWPRRLSSSQWSSSPPLRPAGTSRAGSARSGTALRPSRSSTSCRHSPCRPCRPRSQPRRGMGSCGSRTRRARSGTWAEIRVPVAPPVGGRGRRRRRRARADRRRATRVRVAPAAMGRGAAGRPGSSPTSEPTLDAWCFRRCSRGAARSPWSASCWPPTASP